MFPSDNPIVMESIDIIRQTIDRFPNRPAVVAPDGETYSFAEIDSRATRIAHALADLVGDGRTASLTNNVLAAVDVFLASQKRGVANAPLNVRMPADQQAFMADRADAELLLFEAEFEDAARQILETTGIDRAIRIGDGEADVEGATVESYEEVLGWDADAELDRPADAESGIIFTSGTTGRPKGVVIDQEMAYFASTELVMEFGMAPDDVGSIITPFFHVVTPYTWFLPHFQAGASVVLQPSFDPAGALRLVEEHGITNLMGVPAQLKAMLKAQEEVGADLSSLERVRTGGAAITAQTVERIQEEFCEDFHNTYGFTESMGNVLHSYPFEQQEHPAVTGRPGLNWTVRVVEPAKPPEKPDPEATIEPGEQGELLAKGPTTVDGYIDRPEATENLYVDGWLRSGDIAELDEHGNYTIIDRIDNMIVSGAENIYPQEVERILEEHPDIEDVAVIGVPDETWGQAVKAVVVGSATEEELEEFCKSHEGLADYKRPRYYEFTDDLPRSPTGLQRERIRREYGG